MRSPRKSLVALLVVPLIVLVSLVTVGVANARQLSQPDSARTELTTPTITIRSFSYVVPTSVLHGARIKVANNDSVTHTVTSNRAGKFNVSVPEHSIRYFRAPRTPMRYGFHCTFHSSMMGILKVR
ncbi:MAG: hypothetical protein WKF54_09945 [Nocardioidaceae bacterium]